MKPWVRRLVTFLGSCIVLIIVIGLFLQTEYHVSRKIDINSNSETIHTYVGDLSKWDLWSPWKEDDPGIVTTIGAQSSGVGASQSWIAKDGDGSLTFTMSSPIKGIEYDLFFDGGAYRCWAAMLYTPVNDQKTTVTWSMKGKMDMPIMGGYFALMMDSMVGKMFARGLTKLKQVVEPQ